jgi:hypothetical protein
MENLRKGVAVMFIVFGAYLGIRVLALTNWQALLAVFTFIR